MTREKASPASCPGCVELEKRLEQRGKKILSLEQSITDTKKSALMMADDYKRRFDILKNSAEEFRKLVEAERDKRIREVGELHARIAELNARNGDTVKKLRDVIRELDQRANDAESQLSLLVAQAREKVDVPVVQGDLIDAVALESISSLAYGNKEEQAPPT
jgi:hypothetical protein